MGNEFSVDSDTCSLKYLLIGPARSGKTQFCNKMLKGIFEPTYTPTNGPQFLSYTSDLDADKDIICLMVDVGSSINQNTKYLSNLYFRANGILVFYDSSNLSTLSEAKEIVQSLKNLASGNSLKAPSDIHLIGTKNDCSSIGTTELELIQSVSESIGANSNTFISSSRELPELLKPKFNVIVASTVRKYYPEVKIKLVEYQVQKNESIIEELEINKVENEKSESRCLLI